MSLSPSNVAHNKRNTTGGLGSSDECLRFLPHTKDATSFFVSFGYRWFDRIRNDHLRIGITNQMQVSSYLYQPGLISYNSGFFIFRFSWLTLFWSLARINVLKNLFSHSYFVYALSITLEQNLNCQSPWKWRQIVLNIQCTLLAHFSFIWITRAFFFYYYYHIVPLTYRVWIVYILINFLIITIRK